jgi:hypothetical protein
VRGPAAARPPPPRRARGGGAGMRHATQPHTACLQTLVTELPAKSKRLYRLYIHEYVSRYSRYMFVHIAVTAVIRPFFGGRGFVVKKCNLKKQGLAAVDADMHAEEAQLLQQLAAAVTATAGSSSHAGAGVRASNSAPPLMPPISPSQSVDSQSVNSAPGCAQLPRPRGRPPPRPWRGPPPLCLDTA